MNEQILVLIVFSSNVGSGESAAQTRKSPLFAYMYKVRM